MGAIRNDATSPERIPVSCLEGARAVTANDFRLGIPPQANGPHGPVFRAAHIRRVYLKRAHASPPLHPSSASSGAV